MYSNYWHAGLLIPFWGIVGLGILGFISMILIVWLKGTALWHAAKRHEVWWFVAMLVINTAGILELVYLVFFAKVKWNEVWPLSLIKKKEHHGEHRGEHHHL
jgi:methionyl-tRNA synthetase